MNVKKPKKILIIGIYGSGKTTLAKMLSKLLRYRMYDQDDIKYERKYDKTRSSEKIRIKINKISKQQIWIFSGTWLDYLLPLYKNADLVIFLEIPKIRLYARIFKRHFQRKQGEKEYFIYTLKDTWKIIKKVKRYFDDPSCFITLEKHRNYINNHSRKMYVIKNNKDINHLIWNLNNSTYH